MNLDILKDKKVLYAEDEKELANETISLLELFFNKIYYAQNGKEALKLYRKYSPDILLLDIYMPFIDGLSLLKQIRQKDNKTIAIILTAFDDKNTLLKAVELNITKFLTKPFTKYEFDKTLKLCATKFQEKSLKLDHTHSLLLDSMQIYDGEKYLSLTNKEFLLIKFLAQNQGRVCHYEELINVVYDYNNGNKESLKAVLKELRKKCGFLKINNFFGIGYSLSEV